MPFHLHFQPCSSLQGYGDQPYNLMAQSAFYAGLGCLQMIKTPFIFNSLTPLLLPSKWMSVSRGPAGTVARVWMALTPSLASVLRVTLASGVRIILTSVSKTPALSTTLAAKIWSTTLPASVTKASQVIQHFEKIHLSVLRNLQLFKHPF